MVFYLINEGCDATHILHFFVTWWLVARFIEESNFFLKVKTTRWCFIEETKAVM